MAETLTDIRSETESQTLYGENIQGVHHTGLLGERRLSWLSLGDPDGRPVFYAHGNPGSRLELFFYHRIAEELGIRLLAVERPGFGDSAFDPSFTLQSVANDVIAVANHSGIQTFAVMGWSSGGPPSLAVARYYPERVSGAVILSSYTNFGEMTEARRLMMEDELKGPELAEERPHLFHGLVRAVGWTSRHLPGFYMKVTRAEMPSPDQQVFENSERQALFTEVQKAAFKQGAEGAIRDLELQWEAWPFELAEVPVPVTIYQGKQDVFVPWEFARHMDRELPDSTLQLLPEQGHLYPLLPSYQNEIFSQLAD